MSTFRDEVAGLIPELRVVARALSGRDGHLADDLVQDTLLSALRAQAQFTPGTNLRAWLLTILRNRYRSVISRKHVASEIAVETLDELSWVPPEQEAKIEVAAFRRAFTMLHPSQREALVLVCVQGLSYERAAELMGCEVGTVKSRLNRARTALKRMLLEDELAPAQRTPSAATGASAPRRADHRPDLRAACATGRARLPSNAAGAGLGVGDDVSSAMIPSRSADTSRGSVLSSVSLR